MSSNGLGAPSQAGLAPYLERLARPLLRPAGWLAIRFDVANMTVFETRAARVSGFRAFLIHQRMFFFAVSGKFPTTTFAASLSQHGPEAAHHWDGSKSQSSLTAHFSKMPVRLPKPDGGRTWGDIVDLCGHTPIWGRRGQTSPMSTFTRIAPEPLYGGPSDGAASTIADSDAHGL